MVRSAPLGPEWIVRRSGSWSGAGYSRSKSRLNSEPAYQTADLRLPNGKMEKAGSQNGTFMLSNRDNGRRRGRSRRDHAHREEHGLQGMDQHRPSLGRRQRLRHSQTPSISSETKSAKLR